MMGIYRKSVLFQQGGNAVQQEAVLEDAAGQDDRIRIRVFMKRIVVTPGVIPSRISFSRLRIIGRVSKIRRSFCS